MTLGCLRAVISARLKSGRVVQPPAPPPPPPPPPTPCPQAESRGRRHTDCGLVASDLQPAAKSQLCSGMWGLDPSAVSMCNPLKSGAGAGGRGPGTSGMWLQHQFTEVSQGATPGHHMGAESMEVGGVEGKAEIWED